MEKIDLRSEIIACGRDPSYFINRYVKIQHPKRGIIPFKTFDYQDELLRDYKKHRSNIILKARQLGISEVTAAYALWLMLFHRDKNILVMASKANTAKNIVRKVRTAIRYLPRWLMLADIATDNKLSIELTNGSRIQSIATSEDAGRSEALSLLIIDEAAFVPRLDELWTGLYPTISAGGSVIVLSTPNGVGNKFHQLYVEAENGNNELHPHKYMWWVHPERISDLQDDPNRPGFKTSSWYRKEIKQANMSVREVAQELECEFNSSGDTVIPAESIELLEKSAFDPIERAYTDRNLFVWERPATGKNYFISADVSRGDGKDYSAFHVWDSQTMTQVAEYNGKVPPDEYAKLLCQVGREYNQALLVVENTGIGAACLEHVKLLNYENVYFSRKNDTKTGQAFNIKWGLPAMEDFVIGFTTSQKTRPLIVAKLEEFIRNRAVTLRSRRFPEQLRTFIWVGGRGEALKGWNDDLIMSAAVGVWIRDTFMAPGMAEAGLDDQLIKNIKYESHNNKEVAGASKNPDHVPSRQLGVFAPQVKPVTKMTSRNGHEIDLSWLYK